MEDRTLLLSAAFEPIKIISWRKAVILSLLGKADVLEHYTRQIRSPSLVLHMPAVVKLQRMVRYVPRRVKFSRQNLYFRDRYTCQYCHTPHPSHQLTYDHVVPRSRGGGTNWTNVVTACVRCNLKKGSKLVHQVNFRLLQEPYEPRWLPAFTPELSVDNAPLPWRGYLAWQSSPA